MGEIRYTNTQNAKINFSLFDDARLLWILFSEEEL